jgi:lysyl-tRNA synthetase class 1
MLVQIPGVDVAARVEAEKGSPLSERERAIFEGRAAAARAWLDAYAPDRARLAVQPTLPPAASELDVDQRAFLAALRDAVSVTAPSGGDAWQAAIFAAATGAGLPAGRAFAALYQAFLGRANGPRAGWLLAGLEPSFVLDRLREAAGETLAAVATDRGER